MCESFKTSFKSKDTQMTNWLSASGQIKKLSPEEMSWWKAVECGKKFFEIVSVDDGEPYLDIISVPEGTQVGVLQEFFRKFRPVECVAITWACESGTYFGGGACLIAAEEDHWNHTGIWAEKAEKDFYSRQKRKSRKKKNGLD
jgi:hypothetical protein